jgi:site-specific DNA recombinase
MVEAIKETRSPMIAGIYGRKSTDQAGVAADQKSIARQIEHARAYAAAKGWTVDETCIFVDDGISGAEFSARPGFVRLMNALKPRPSFQGLIMSEVSRLGREQIETAYALKQLSVAGVRCFSYLEDRELLMESATDKFLLGAVTFAADLEREKARQRTFDALHRKAKAGHVCGGKTFGYRNHPVTDASGKRSHVERQIDPIEAAVVRQIFDLCAMGHGFTRIAKGLNMAHAPAPRPQQQGPGGWSPSTIREVLFRDLYRGQVTWNKSRKRNRWGQQQQQARPATDWLRVDAPALRIVSDEQWNAAHQRLAGIRSRLEHLTGRAVDGRSGPRRRGNDSAYLLSGFARCALCGGGVGVTSRSHGRERQYFYACVAHHKRGRLICGNGLAMRIETVDAAVLGTLHGETLRPAIINATITGVLDAVAAAMNPRTAARDLDASRAELRTVERELGRLAEAVAAGGQDLVPLLALLRTKQQRRDDLAALITTRTAPRSVAFNRQAIETKVRERLATWRSLLLTKKMQDTRDWLREGLIGPLKLTPEGRTYRFEGQLSLGKLFAGLVPALPTVGTSPTGFEPVFWP